MANPVLGPDQNGKYWRLSVDASGGTGQEQPSLTEATGPSIGPSDGTLFTPTYNVEDALTLAQKMAKGVPFAGVDLTICNIVNSTIYRAYPWRDTLEVIPSGTIPLVDGNQDYELGAVSMMRPTQWWIIRTDTTPPQIRQIDVAKNLYADLVARSPYSIRTAALQAGVRMVRLESAVRISSGTTWELGGEYQPHPAKLASTDTLFWFADEFLEVFAKGLIYWAYSFADRSEAGTMVVDGNGRKTYTGKLGEFMAAINEMAATEDFGNIDGYYPDEPVGAVDGRFFSGYQIF